MWSQSLLTLADGLTPKEHAPLWAPYTRCARCECLHYQPVARGRCVCGHRKSDHDLASPQNLAFHSEADELYYGGSAGSGKTDLLLGLAFNSHHKSIIFRREFPQLQDVVDRGNEILAGHGRYTGSPTPRWRMADGRTVELGSVPHEKDRERYRGRPHDLKAFDEISTFPYPIYTFLKAWLRTILPDQRTRIVCAGNPPGTEEGLWVIEHWAPWLQADHKDPAKPGELRWFVLADDDSSLEVEGPGEYDVEGRTVVASSRTFIPARLSDNPILAATDYEKTLMGLPKEMRVRLLDGLFIGMELSTANQVIPTAWIKLAMDRWEAMRPADLSAQTALGVDVARSGADATAVSPLYGRWWDELEVVPGEDTPDGGLVADLVERVRRGAPAIGVDIIGIGSSPFDLMRRRGVPNVIAVDFGAGTSWTDRSGALTFANIRAAAYWKLRDILDPLSGEQAALPPDPALMAELRAVRYTEGSRRILLEPKKNIRARLGRSPDRADAIVLGLWAADQQGTIEAW